MNIAENILRHNLRNVYFLTGSPCGGKTTMCRALAEKYGFMFFNGNHREAGFATWQELCDETNQPVSSRKTTDWETFFNRPTKEYLDWLDGVGAEYSQYAVIELVKLAQTRTVVTDIDLPSSLLNQIATPGHVACMLTTPDLVVRDYYRREDHRDIYDCILSLSNPQRALENNQTVLRRLCGRATEQARQAGWFCIFRDENSTVDASLARLEAYFGLTAL
jgi:adenylate kinase family enzyme